MKEIKFDQEARAKLLSGVEILEKAVSSTLGAKGRNVIYKSGGSHIVTKDGVTVARQVVSEDSIEQAAIDIVREAASRTARDAGDGTTSATVIAASIIRTALQHVGNGSNPMDLKRGIDRAVTEALARIDIMKKSVDSDEDIMNIATISANNDPVMGALVADIFKKVGKDGAIRIEETQQNETKVDTVEGCHFISGYLSPSFVNNKVKGIADYKDVMVLITDKIINESFDDLVPTLNIIVEKANAESKNIALLIICGDMEGEPLGTLVINKLKQNFPVVAVKAPEFGTERDEVLEDLAIITGGTVISESKGLKLSDVKEEHLGQADRVIVDKDYTTIIGRKGEVPAMQDRVEYINNLKKEDKQNAQTWRLDKRIAMLTGGVGVVYVGGRSEQEMKETFFRLEDSLSATKAALKDGYVVGGGVAYINVSKALKSLIMPQDRLESHGQDMSDVQISFMNNDQKLGYVSVVKALLMPFIKIIENSGGVGAVKLSEVYEMDGDMGYNSLTGEIESLIDSGIIDPSQVAKSAIANAASVAGMIITTNCVITEKSKD